MNFDSFIKENKKTTIAELPEEVTKSAKTIVDGNFDHALKKTFDGDMIRFKVNPEDFNYVDPQQHLELELGEGPSKKRKFDVTLIFVQAIEATEREKEKSKDSSGHSKVGGELIYKIEFKPKELSDDENTEHEQEEEDDVWNKPDPDDEDLIPEEPEEEGKPVSSGRKKVHIEDLNTFFQTSDGDDDSEL
jgi:hypothetical protein